MHIRQSRFRLVSVTSVSEQDSVKAVLEFDALVTNNGNERVSNSWVPRIRHAYVEYRGFLVGQTWSTFMDVGVLPETLDFLGVIDGITFNRQALVRYKTGAWEFALENPQTTLSPLSGGTRITPDTSSVPDAVVRYTWNNEWGYIKLAGLYRQLAINIDDIDASEASYGVSFTGRVNLTSSNNIKFSLFSGIGLGRYAGLNVVNAGVLIDNENIETIDSRGMSLAYRHAWNEKLRSNFTFSRFEADNNVLITGSNATESTQSIRANLLYSPVSKITLGGEVTFAEREIESGGTGDLQRLQLSFKYGF